MNTVFENLILDYNLLEESDRLKKRLLLLVFFFLAIHHSFFSIYTFSSNKIQSASEGFSALCVIIGMLTIKYKLDLLFSTAILAFYSFLSISVGVWENGGIFSSEISWYIITIFSITIALDRKVGIWFYILTSLVVLLMGFLQYFKLYDFTKNLLSNGQNYTLLSCTSVFLIVGIILRFVFTSEEIDKLWKRDKVEKIELLEIEKANQVIQDKINSMNFTKQLLENTEVERKRIATDLHDSISHELLNLKSVFVQQDISAVNTKIDAIINDVRGISRNLHPVMFDKIGLVPNIEQLVERMQIQNNFLVSTAIEYQGSLASADELQIYRIIQEALTNIIKYANAYAAKITILETHNHVGIEIRDNGNGFVVKQTLNSGKAFGLHNIIERSRVIGGEANIESSASGTVINIGVPKKLASGGNGND
jgi:signal transduction histidine kinase